MLSCPNFECANIKFLNLDAKVCCVQLLGKDEQHFSVAFF